MPISGTGGVNPNAHGNYSHGGFKGKGKKKGPKHKGEHKTSGKTAGAMFWIPVGLVGGPLAIFLAIAAYIAHGHGVI